MDDLAEKVQSLFYDYIHFNSINARMHTTLKCETPDGWSSDQVFKIDTGANGNLMPISMFAKLFPKVSLDALNRTVNKNVTLYAYNDMEIKQFGTCGIRLNFKGKTQVCKFFVVEHEMAIVGMDSEISINLKDEAIPHVEPIRYVPHAMQEPLKIELEKLGEMKEFYIR